MMGTNLIAVLTVVAAVIAAGDHDRRAPVGRDKTGTRAGCRQILASQMSSGQVPTATLSFVAEREGNEACQFIS